MFHQQQIWIREWTDFQIRSGKQFLQKSALSCFHELNATGLDDEPTIQQFFYWHFETVFHVKG
ncbi:hypothetical protein Q5O89_19770 [Peribacillus frigoritolerans]|nr:hypothetical protein [Peribacillus frigoritolerans]